MEYPMKNVLISGFLACCLSFNGFSADEVSIKNKYNDEKILKIYKNNFRTFQGTLSSLDHKKIEIGFFKFENQNGFRGTLVISSGRAESTLKFIEMAEDFIEAGFNTVYVLDQRGQGLSTRLQKTSGPKDQNYEKVHLDKWNLMTDDLASFVNNEMLKHSKAPYVALGHITGALPVVDYMQRVPGKQIFSKVVLVSPLFKLKTGKIEQFLFDGIISPLYGTFSDDSRVPFQEKKNQIGDCQNNNRTHSSVRCELVKQTIKLVPESFSENSTVRWANEIFKFQKNVLSNEKNPETPTLIVTAKNDELLDNTTSEQFCQTKLGHCTYVEIEGSKHWVMFEKDEIRNRAFNSIINFLE